MQTPYISGLFALFFKLSFDFGLPFTLVLHYFAIQNSGWTVACRFTGHLHLSSLADRHRPQLPADCEHSTCPECSVCGCVS